MTKTKAKREPTYLLDCVLPPTDVIADVFLAKNKLMKLVDMKARAMMNHFKRQARSLRAVQPGVGSALGLISWAYLNCIWLTVVHNLGPAFDVQLTLLFRHLPPFPRLIIFSCFLFFVSRE
jgi:hypothetical protein